MTPNEVSRTEYHEINQAEVIRALTEAQRHDPEVVRALADIQLAEIQSRESIAGFFLQVLIFSADQLHVDRRLMRASVREKRLSRAFELAGGSLQMLGRECAALECGTDLQTVLDQMDRVTAPPPWTPELPLAPEEDEWSQ